ncbi:MAG: ABC transporter ATP-binding protein [SAR324 cluster bacterium]|nr:ABC transporter ATP-binding protein [SAR324 cluster bacterium]
MSTIQLSNITINRGKPPADLLSRLLAFLAPEPGNMKPFSIEGLNLTIPHGKTLVILGPSGCGKSTLLRVISGLEEPDAGRVSYDGWDAKGISPGQRRIGMVFQNYALYPNLDNKENITSYFFFRKKTPEFVRMREEKFRRTSQLLDVEIEHLLHRMPSNLSGGEQQRVALGRCITRDPALFLMDEPFSNLDAKLRTKYRLHLKRLLKEFNITTVYVTHDQQEAVLLGDLVSIMRIETQEQKIIGRVEQTGTVRELYDQPVNAYVADFFNLHGDIQPISFVDGEVFDRALAACQIGVRPEDLRLGKKEKRPALRARVTEITVNPIQQNMTVILNLRGTEITGKIQLDLSLAAGEEVDVQFSKYFVFDRDSGRRTAAPEQLCRLIG